MAKLTDDELIAQIEKEEAMCISHYASVLSEQRRLAIDYYYGKPYGNEQEGRSQVVTTEVKDSVEGILPSLMSIFTSSSEVVRFEAQTPEDEAEAQMASDYVNYVFSRLNNGFLALYCLFKDALMVKNGYVKVYWEDYEDRGQETYTGLNDIDLQTLMADPELELKDLKSYPDPMAPPMMGPMGPLPPPNAHDAVFMRTKKQGRVCIVPCPPEEVLVSRECLNELSTARFVEHRTLKTLSEIREMGYKVDDSIADYAPQADFNMERIARLSYDDALAYRFDEDGTDPATRRVWLCEAYIHCDYDGDGIAELRKVTKVGRTLLDNVEFDSLPVIGGSAIPMPHKHYGLSIYDLVHDIQMIKSTVMRQLLDNAYVANNGRMEVLDGMVNMTDLLTVRPNGVVRVKALGSVKRIDNPLLGAPFYNLLEYLDKAKNNRIGATDFPNAVEPEAINAKATFVDAYRNAALERINLMARILAEGPVKQIFWKILELICKHQDKPRMAKLRGQWVRIDPRQWKNRFDMTVTVGLGKGNQQTTLQGAMGIMDIQAGMLKAGLMGQTLTPDNIYEAARMYAKAVFPREADALFTKPGTVQPPPEQPNIDLMKLQLDDKKLMMSDAQKRARMAADMMKSNKQLGVQVLGMASAHKQQSEQHLHEHIQNAMEQGMAHAQHQDTLNAQASSEAADREMSERQTNADARAVSAEGGSGVSSDTAMLAIATALQNLAQSNVVSAKENGAPQAQAIAMLAGALQDLANKPPPPRIKFNKAVRDDKGTLIGAEPVYESLH